MNKEKVSDRVKNLLAAAQAVLDDAGAMWLAEAQHTSFLAQARDLLAEIERLEGRRAELRREVADAESELKAVQDKHSIVAGETAAMRNDVAAEERRLRDELEGTIAVARKDANREIAKIGEEIIAAKGELASTKAEIGGIVARISEFKKRISA